MTDVNALVPNNQAVPTEMGYGLKPSMVNSRMFYLVQNPQSNSTNITAGSTVTHRIPVRRNCFLDQTQSFMKITIKNNAAGTINLDNSGYAVINRQDVYHQSNLCDQILNYNRIANYLLDNTLDGSQHINLSTSLGFAPDGSKAGAAIDAGEYLTVCLPMLGGVVGVNAEKMLPLFALSDDIEVQTLLENQSLAFYSAADYSATPYTLTSFELHLAYVEISDEAMAQVRQTFGQQIYIGASTWRCAPVNLESTVSGAVSSLVPARYSSLRSLHFLCSPSSDQVYNAYSLSSRVNPYIATAQLRAGATTTPNKPLQFINAGLVGGFAEAYSAIQRSLHSLTSTECEGIYSIAGFNVAPAAIANTPVGAKNTGANSHINSFGFAFELESVAHKNSVLVAGMNTLGTNVFLDLTISNAPTENYTLYTVHNIDTILVVDVESGVMTVRI